MVTKFKIGDRVQINPHYKGRSLTKSMHTEILKVFGGTVGEVVGHTDAGPFILVNFPGRDDTNTPTFDGIHFYVNRDKPTLAHFKEDEIILAVPIYKGRRHSKPLSEAKRPMEERRFRPGDRVRVLPDAADKLDRHRWNTASIPPFVDKECTFLDYFPVNDLCLILGDSPMGVQSRYGGDFSAEEVAQQLGITIPELNSRWTHVTEDGLEFVIPDASKMYPSRRRG